MGKYISVGNFEKKYLIYVLIYFIGLSSMSEGLYNFTFEQKMNIFSRQHTHILIEYVIKNIILSLFIIPELIINYIYKTNKETKKVDKLTPKKIIHIIICTITHLLNHISEKILLYKISLCYFQGVQILLSFIVSKYYFKNKCYRHQYFSLLVINVLIIISNICEIYYSHNYSISKYSTSDFKMGLFFSISFGLFQCFSEVSYSRIFIEEYLFSPFKVCYFFGFINTIVGIIVSIIVSYITINSKEYFFVYYNYKKYFDNYKDFFKNFYSPGFFYGLLYNLIEIIFIFLVALSFQYYALSYVYYFFIISAYVHQVQVARFNFFLSKNNKFHTLIVICTIFFIIEMFMNLIVLEFIELNFWGFNKNLKKNIAKRADDDIHMELLEDKKIYDDDDYVTKVDDNPNRDSFNEQTLNKNKNNDETLNKNKNNE